MTASRWWREDGALHRFISDLVYAELQRSRPGLALPVRPWPVDLSIGRDGLAADSLERVSLATALTQALQLQRSGKEDLLLARHRLAEWVEICHDSLELFADQMIFHTSGSTGPAKSCNHLLPDLEREIDSLTAVIGPRRRIVAAVPSHHIYGFLFTLMLPHRLSAPVLSGVATSPLSLRPLLREGDLIIGFPDFWRLATQSISDFPPDIIGVTSTAPCPRDIGPALRRLGLSRLLEIYGSSETAGIGWREAEDSDYRLFDHWQKTDDPAFLRRRDSPQGLPVALQDRLIWRQDRHFCPDGRLDGAVQVGGINVWPARVAAQLATHPLVAEAAVRLMRPSEGVRLKAFLVLRDPSADRVTAQRDILSWAAELLSTPELPKAVTFGPTLPRDPTGKASDWPLKENF